jgi:hypothetical protein
VVGFGHVREGESALSLNWSGEPNCTYHCISLSYAQTWRCW